MQSVRSPAPTRRTALVRVGPFLAAFLVAGALVPLAGIAHPGEVALGLGTLLGLCALGVARPTLTHGRWALAATLLAVAAIAVLRDGTGGMQGGYGPLLVVAVLWTALYGRRRQVAVATGAVAVALLAPLLLVGGAAYPATGYRSTPLLVVACAFAGTVVQTLLARERALRGTAVAAADQRRGLLSAMADGVIVTDLRGRVLEVNGALCRMTGFEAAEVLGTRAPLPSWPEEDHEELLRRHAAAIAAGGGSFDARLVTRAGRELHVIISLAVSVGTEGPVVVGTVKDVSEQVHLRRTLEQALARSRAIVDTMEEGYGLTRDGEVLEVNPALCRLTGFSREELVGARVPYPFWPPERMEEILAERERLTAPGGGTTELELRRKDGTRFLAEMTTVPVLEGDGTPMGFLSTVRDVTERRAAERLRVRREEELRALVEVTRTVAHAHPADAPAVICRVAVQLTGAAGAALLALGEDGTLRPRVASEPAPAGLHDPALPAAAHAALDADRPTLLEGGGCVQPITSERGALGVLVLGPGAAPEGLASDVRALLALLGAEAAHALVRAADHAELERMARTDALTGLANRRAIEEALPRELARARRAAQPLSVALIDLDRFKAYNDEHGHLAGDRLLREASARWADRLRASDLLGRWGGEEFCLLLGGCSREDAQRVLEELRGLLPDEQSFSAGLVTLLPDGEVAPAGLLLAADRALYRAKEAGRGCTIAAEEATTA